MREELFQKIFKEQKKTLKYFDVPNPTKVVIAFSGVPGSGKTTIAKRLEDRYKGLRIHNDSLRQIIRKEIGNDESTNLQETLLEYIEFMRRELAKYSNKIIIIDSSIDRRHEVIPKFYEPKGYKLFVIKLDIPREEIERRIKTRNADNPVSFLEKLDGWFEDTKNFEKLRQADFIIKEGSEEELKKLEKEVDKLI